MALDIVTPIVGKIGEYLVAPVGRQLGYIIFYNRKINNLRDKLEKLKIRINDMQESVVVATRNGEKILNVVTDWMKKVDEFKLEAVKFLEDDVNLNKRCFNGWFPNLMTYHRLGKKAQKKAMAAIKLHSDGNFAAISTLPSQGKTFVPSQDFVAYETTRQAMMKVMEALRNENTNFIGIYGMGGVGKTTLVKEIRKMAKEEKLCDEVVMAIVSQNRDVQNIRDQIADLLGLQFIERSDIGQANRLYARLKDVRKVLIILDDVWARLDVADIGIPFGDDHKGCKIIITTRRKQVCSAMSMGNETTEIVHLNVLSEQESWDLFKKNVGDVVDSPTLKYISEAMVNECHGLPVAIITVGRAMRGKDLDEWKEAIEELKRSVPRNIEGVEEDVYRCLKLSYNYLPGEEAKSCFLLCSLFPEDHQIQVELLVRYGFGLGLFKNVDTVLQARRKANAIINNLKDSCLLMEGKSKRYVKMHDVVRDVAISIGSDKYCVRAGVGLKGWPNVESLDQYTGISMIENGIEKLPDVCENTNIQIMLFQGNKLTFKGSFFQGTQALRVLDVSNYIRPQPKMHLESFCCLTSLRTLVLEGFEIGDVVALGQIKTLEILSLRKGSLDRPLIALGELSNLRLLDITNCKVNSDSSIILPNMFSKLSRLEELYLAGTRTRWRFGSGNELKSFPCLTTLTSYIDNVESWLPEDFVFPDLERFNIYKVRYLARFNIYKIRHHSVDDNYLEICKSNRSTRWWLNCLKPLLTKTNCLCLLQLKDISNVIPEVGVDLNELKALKVWKCIGLEYLIKTEELEILPNDQRYQQLFFNLETLYLQRLDNFKGICNDVIPSTISVAKLKHVRIERCDKLLGPLFSSDLLLLLHQLETIELIHCLYLEKLFDFELHGDGAHEPIFLFNLRELKIEWLSRLKDLWNFNSRFVPLNLCNLRVVEIVQCHELKYIFHHSVAQSLQQLEEITVEKCEALEEIVAKENQQQEDDDEAVDKKIVFKCLKEIALTRLPSLKAFCTGSFPFEWPSLEEVSIRNCPQMKTFVACPQMKTFVAATSTTRSTPNLKSIKLDRVEIFQQGVDFDTAMENHFKEKDVSSDGLIEIGESSTSAIPIQDVSSDGSRHRSIETGESSTSAIPIQTLPFLRGRLSETGESSTSAIQTLPFLSGRLSETRESSTSAIPIQTYLPFLRGRSSEIGKSSTSAIQDVSSDGLIDRLIRSRQRLIETGESSTSTIPIQTLPFLSGRLLETGESSTSAIPIQTLPFLRGRLSETGESSTSAILIQTLPFLSGRLSEIRESSTSAIPIKTYLPFLRGRLSETRKSSTSAIPIQDVSSDGLIRSRQRLIETGESSTSTIPIQVIDLIPLCC